ncbi:unnamed protein product, partial [Vitis vinifera]|uniref:Uncharacterized protein n=1 Tax=Vitis vinifera TaxID=29760 RepID=D7T2S8_VITVI
MIYHLIIPRRKRAFSGAYEDGQRVSIDVMSSIFEEQSAVDKQMSV